MGGKCHSLVLNENLASTSVETRPGMILRISLPNSTRRRSMAFSACSSRSLQRASAEPTRLSNTNTTIRHPPALALAELDGGVDELLVCGELGRGEAGVSGARVTRNGYTGAWEGAGVGGTGGWTWWWRRKMAMLDWERCSTTEGCFPTGWGQGTLLRSGKRIQL